MPSNVYYHSPRRRQLQKLQQKASPTSVIDHNTTTSTALKKVYLIRHGQSQGQVAHLLNMDRKTDMRLLDCPLSDTGKQQAMDIPKYIAHPIDLLISSPLTRALQTALLAFPDRRILVHYDLREIGPKVPENRTRPWTDVRADLPPAALDERVDATTFQPRDWPRDYTPLVVRRDRIRQFWTWLAQQPHNVIVVVCHYHVIRASLASSNLAPRNAIPILCHLTTDGDLIPCHTTAADQHNHNAPNNNNNNNNKTIS